MTAPLRKVLVREGPNYATVETLECGHLHEPKQMGAYPDAHLRATRRRCHKCLQELVGPRLQLRAGP